MQLKERERGIYLNRRRKGLGRGQLTIAVQVQVHVRGGSGEEGDASLHTQFINTVALTTHTSRSWGVGGGKVWGGTGGGVGGGEM